MKLEFKPIEIADEQDRDGLLVLQDGRLVAILCQLSDGHGETAGRWFMECGFGPLGGREEDFADLAAAELWFENELRTNAG
jgi:hypothetical protein